jgi:hypothetical protein
MKKLINLRLLSKIRKMNSMKKQWGCACIHFDPHCSVCMAWKIFNKIGEVPSAEDVACFPGSNVKYRSGAD